ncbi:hypothetical protein [Tepidimonas charontis]|uniref:hypothetical protein n=1 Tax=Tepidimonas charontis TaxID=2267262 RepID=UPI0011853CC0|nr:hypothetical protein [Tepidimonas charontis]
MTIVEGTRPGGGQSGDKPANAPVPARAVASGARAPSERVEPEQQRQRDAEARRILEQELRRAEERLQRARADYADGRPPPLATENADTAAYQARVQELRARVERAEADVAAIRREMGRLGGADGR